MAKRKSVFDPRLKSIVRAAIGDYTLILSIRDYRIDLAWCSEPKSGEREDADLHGEISVDRRYLTATITFYPAFAAKWKRDKSIEDMRAMVAHELAHIATEHMKELIYEPFKGRDEVRDAWESLTSRIANLMTAIKP